MDLLPEQNVSPPLILYVVVKAVAAEMSDLQHHLQSVHSDSGSMPEMQDSEFSPFVYADHPMRQQTVSAHHQLLAGIPCGAIPKEEGEEHSGSGQSGQR